MDKRGKCHDGGLLVLILAPAPSPWSIASHPKYKLHICTLDFINKGVTLDIRLGVLAGRRGNEELDASVGDVLTYSSENPNSSHLRKTVVVRKRSLIHKVAAMKSFITDAFSMRITSLIVSYIDSGTIARPNSK